jgi:hypothetical protein
VTAIWLAIFYAFLFAASAACSPSSSLVVKEGDFYAICDSIPAKSGLALWYSVFANQANLQSLLVEYVARNVDRPGDQELRVTVGAKGQNRFVRVIHVTQKDEEIDISDHTSIYNGKSFNVYYPQDHVYETSKRFAIPEFTVKVRASAFFECLAWWPPGDRSSPPRLFGHPFFLIDAFLNSSWSIDAAQELVDGRWCHVVRCADFDVMWIDAARGVVVRRVRSLGRSPHVTYEFRDYRMISGVWLPYKILRTLHFDADRRTEFIVDRCMVNDVDDEWFRFHPAPGCLVSDRDTDKTDQVPGGFDSFSATLHKASLVLKARVSVAPSFVTGTGLGVCCGVLFVIAVETLLFGRKGLTLGRFMHTASFRGKG